MSELNIYEEHVVACSLNMLQILIAWSAIKLRLIRYLTTHFTSYFLRAHCDEKSLSVVTQNFFSSIRYVQLALQRRAVRTSLLIFMTHLCLIERPSDITQYTPTLLVYC